MQLLRFGVENLDSLYNYGLGRIGNVVVAALGAAADFNTLSGTDDVSTIDDRLSFHQFLITLLELVHRMIPSDFYPPITHFETHMMIIETFFYHNFGKPYLMKQIPSTFDEFNMIESMSQVIGYSYQIMADVFLFCIAPSKFGEWTEQERKDRYVRIACGDAFVEFESLMELVKKLRMPLNLLSSEPMYETFCRFDSGMRKDRAVVDFQGFTLVCAHMSFSLFLTNAMFPTPQAKFQRMVEQYFVPNFPSRNTIPGPLSSSQMTKFEGIKPERASQGTVLWVFGQNFPIRQTQNGNRCPIYVRFNDVIVKGSCMSNSVGNIMVPRLPTTDDTVTQVTLADGDESGTYVIKREARTLVAISISNDRLRWTKNQEIYLSFEDVLATYAVPMDIVQTLSALFTAFGEKGPDYEHNGELMAGSTYLSLLNWSKICQNLPMCVFDDGDMTTMVARHQKFFKCAKPRSDAGHDCPCACPSGYGQLNLQTVYRAEWPR